MRRAQLPPARFSVGHQMSKRPDFEFDREQARNGPILRNNNGNGAYTIGRPTDVFRYGVGEPYGNNYNAIGYPRPMAPPTGQFYGPSSMDYPRPLQIHHQSMGPRNMNTKPKKRRDGKPSKSKKPVLLGLKLPAPIPGTIKTTVGVNNSYERAERPPPLQIHNRLAQQLYYQDEAAAVYNDGFDFGGRRPFLHTAQDVLADEAIIAQARARAHARLSPRPISPNMIKYHNNKKLRKKSHSHAQSREQAFQEDISNNNDLFDNEDNFLSFSSDSLVATDQLIPNKNDAHVVMWMYGNGPVSKVKAMKIACTYLGSKLGEPPSTNLRSQPEFSWFYAQVNKMLRIHGNVSQISNSTDTPDYESLWRLFRCFHFMVKRKIGSYDQLVQLLLMEDASVKPEEFLGYKDTLMDSDSPPNNVSRRNPVLAAMLTNSVRGFLIVYGHAVEIGNITKWQNLVKNTLNERISNFRRNFGEAVVPGPNLTWSNPIYPQKLESQLQENRTKYGNSFMDNNIRGNLSEVMPMRMDERDRQAQQPENAPSKEDSVTVKSKEVGFSDGPKLMDRLRRFIKMPGDSSINSSFTSNGGQADSTLLKIQSKSKHRDRRRKANPKRKGGFTMLPWQPNQTRPRKEGDKLPEERGQVVCVDSPLSETSSTSSLPIEGAKSTQLLSVDKIPNKYSSSSLETMSSGIAHSDLSLSSRCLNFSDDNNLCSAAESHSSLYQFRNPIYTHVYQDNQEDSMVEVIQKTHEDAIPSLHENDRSVPEVPQNARAVPNLPENDRAVQKKTQRDRGISNLQVKPKFGCLKKPPMKPSVAGTIKNPKVKARPDKSLLYSKKPQKKAVLVDAYVIKRTELSLLNIKLRENGATLQNLNLFGEGDEIDATKTKEERARTKQMRKELRKIQAETQAFKSSVFLNPDPAKSRVLKINRRKQEAKKSKSLHALVWKKYGHASGKIGSSGKVGKNKKSVAASARGQKINAPVQRASTAPPNFASVEMKEKFIHRGIFVPRGYQLTKNSLSPLPRTKTICLDACRYDVVKDVAREMGFDEVGENDVWNIIWTDIPITLDKALEMRRFQDAHSIFWGCSPPLQKANHFPGMGEICRKDRLARNLNRMRKSFPTEYDFFPKTWSLPADISDLLCHSRVKKNSTYICKPDSGCQGRGIFLIRHLKKINPFAKLICQVYIPRPFLIDGYKFDLRIYILITSCDPLHIYIYNEGIARFATVKYEPPSDGNVDVIFMHLTNYSLNKFSQSYAPDPEGSKRKLSSIVQWMEEEGMDVAKLLDDIDSIIVKTMIAAQPTLRHYYRASFPKHDRGCACFEILGFDILLDYRLKPFLLEVNHSPSFNLDLPIDAEIKEQLLRDTFNKIYLGNVCDKRGPLYKPQYRVETPTSDLLLTDTAGHSLSKALEVQFHYENRHQGNFRLIYPSQNALKYAHFFDQTACPTMVDAALLARRRAEASKGSVSYAYPPVVSEDPYVVTRTIDKNGNVATSKKNKNISYIKVPYNPDEDDGGDMERKQFEKPPDFLKAARLRHIMCPMGPTGQRQPLTILEGNPRRNLGGAVAGMYHRNSMSMDNIRTMNPVRVKSPIDYLGDHTPNTRNPLKPTTLYEDVLNNKELGLILGSENRTRTRRHRKVIAKEILEQVQQNRGISMMDENNNFEVASAMARYNLSIPPKVDNHSSRTMEIPTSNSFIFKYPTEGKDLASSLSPAISRYLYRPPGEPHQGQGHDSRSYLDKIREMNENQDKHNRQPMQSFFNDSNEDLRKDCDRVLQAVRNKKNRQHCLMTGDKAALIQQWISDGQKAKLPPSMDLRIQKAQQEQLRKEFTSTTGRYKFEPTPSDEEFDPDGDYRQPGDPNVEAQRREFQMQMQAARDRFTGATTGVTRDSGTVYQVYKHGKKVENPRHIQIERMNPHTQAQSEFMEMYPRDGQRKRPILNEPTGHHFVIDARPRYHGAGGVGPLTQKPPFYNPRSSQPHQIVQGRPPHLRNR